MASGHTGERGLRGPRPATPSSALNGPGEHVLRVCTGLSCWTNGSDGIVDAAKDELNGGESPDGRVTFEETPCGFLCAVAPAVEWDGKWQGRVTADSVRALLRKGAIR